MRRSRIVLVSLAIAIVTAACGSTVPGAESLANSPGGSDPLSLPGRPGSTPLAGGTLGLPTGSSGGPLIPGGGPTGLGGGSSGPVFGKGVTDKEILIGAFRIKNLDAANKAAGALTDSGDQDSYEQIVIDDINKHGGIAGRKIRMDYYIIDAANREPADVAEQRACERWTQDKPAFAVLWGGSDSFRACLAKHGVVQINSGTSSISDDRTFQQFPTYFELTAPDVMKESRALIGGLIEQDFFGAGSKIGLLTWDKPIYHRAVEGVVRPMLAARGLTLDETFYSQVPETEAQTADAIAQTPGVVLRFRGKDINRVIILSDRGGNIVFAFGRAAQSQSYRPRYGLDSGSYPQVHIDQGTLDPSQFKGARGVGWISLFDVGNRPYTTYGPGYARCKKLMEDNGADFPNDYAATGPLFECDAFGFLKAAVEAALPSITQATFLAGAESLGSSFPSALTYAARFGPGRHNGVSAARYFAFHEDCTCFKYSSGLRSIQ